MLDVSQVGNLDVRSCVRDENPDHIILHVGTNDLNSENNPERVAKSSVDLAKGMVSGNRKVAVPGIIPRNEEWNEKALEVNHISYVSDCFDYIDNSDFNPKKHLNNGKLHLNKKESYKHKSVFWNYIITSFKWYKSQNPVGKDSLYDSVSLKQSDYETTESHSTTFPSSNLIVKFIYFGDELKSLCINNINRIIIGQIKINSIDQNLMI